eukprot:CAMPEP_0195309434 /NCGR_PEP_ID=MMETSP0707-20130614/38736_1 /TAXON_ID=33640 /ORGANISM="Asterionellopsis glacialis, Strain CCMP134" /LENGTH=268 /DNA_ID=CAMNT_0040373731 /DNA_START=93 /DNA_END=899 /DNA_ORIENTATION=+
MSDLKESVRSAISAFVGSQSDTHLKADVLRIIRDQATLLYESQVVCDALDADPMEELANVKLQVSRVKNIMEVISCSRTVTDEGQCLIDAVVELRNDGSMKGVKSNIQVTFHYERRPPTPEENQMTKGNMEDGTHVSYWLDLSRDYGERERLLTIEVWAIGQGPSMEEARPLEMDAMEEEDEEDKVESESVNDKENTLCDKFAAYVDPDVLDNFLDWTNLDMDHGASIFLLMTFPFYEHEWDLAGFLIDTVFGGGSDEELEEDEMSEE